jgi:hypothetical protein
MPLVPSEVSIAGVYFPPYLLATALGAAAAGVTALLLNRYRLSRYFFYPPLAFLGLAIFYTGFIATFIIPA